jgi:hypothetical protein
MAGGLMQLVAYGAQDVYLTGDPKVTFFKGVYARHTSFAMEAIKLTLQGSIGNGNLVQVVVGRDGDLISDMWVELAPILSADPVWLAERAFKSVELTIGGQRIDKHYQLWFRLWSEVFQGGSKKLTYGKLTSLGNNVADSSAVSTVSLPLLFFFNKDPGLSLPLIALQYHEVRIIFELDDNYLSYFSPNYFTLWGNYTFLDTKERKMFATKEHEYLIEQLQHNGGDVVGSGILNPSFRMTFQHPVKELLWCYQNPTRTGTKMWNFCVDTANVYNSIAQTSNIAPHWYGSPIINVISPVAQGTYDAGNSISGAPRTQFGYSVSITSDGTAFAEGAQNASAGAGSASVYMYSGGAWSASSLVPSVAISGNYGSSVAISPDGTWAIVGAPTAATNGTAYAFKYINNIWSYWASDLGPTTSKYGTSVAITSGGNVAVGSPGKASNTGEARTHNINNATQAFSAYGTTPINGLANDYFGTSVALDSTGTILAVGAPQGTSTTVLTTVSGTGTVFTYASTPTAGPPAGATYIVTITGSGSSSTMTIGGAQLSALVGNSYYITGLTSTTSSLFTIGADGTKGSALSIGNGTSTGYTFTYYSIGYSKIYRLVAGAWVADTTASMFGTTNSQFGTSVSLNAAGNVLAVGAPGTSTASGYVKVFTYSASTSTWTLASTITTSSASDTFGTSVSLNPAGTSLAVGSPSGGYVRVYQSTSAGVFPAYGLNAYGYSDATGSINFGQSVAISQRLVIGAPAITGATPVITNYLKIYTPVSYAAKTWIEEGGETSTTTAGPLSSLNIDLNGQSRFFPQSGKYFNQYQPWKYHSGSPYPGIYSYSFALKPELNQPSGTCNFSRIDNSQINTILKSAMYTPCNLKLFAVNYNILRITAGMAGVAFSN